ncbi:hypothetical protein H072_6762 [Dactylellina haptotyla CBS 200.50]|uniref:Uncharacterized protein n=1 Tax=Dactylellina haptotyla (strain CBS 200.50) TaxID=1284197 RepID=S8AEB4_DACHA|nr:hypothetical protein H072_6762 [Dactylellina haptotyla CBS 200.50]
MQIQFWPFFALSCLFASAVHAFPGLLPKAGCIVRIRRNAKREDGLTILDLFEDISLSPGVIARADLEKRQSPDSTCACYDTSPTYYPVETPPSYMATPYGDCNIAAKESNLCPSDFLCACQTNGTSSICLPTTVQATTECNTVYPGPFPSSTETRWLYSYAPTDLAAPSGQCGGSRQPAATTEWSPSQTLCPDGQACQSKMRSFYDLNHVSPAYPLSRFFTSWFLPSTVFLVYRAALCLYSVLVIVIANALRPDSAGSRFSYFTWLTYWGITCYLLVSLAHTYSYWKTGRSFLESWPRWLQFLHVLFYSTIVVLPWTVTAVYWAILYDGFTEEYDAWSNISVHALNAVVAFLEITVPRTSPIPWIHIPWFIGILGGYLGVAYITKSTQGYYTYSFLDANRKGAGTTAGYCVGIVAGTIILFAIVKGVIILRVWVTESKLGLKGKFSPRDASRGESTIGPEGEKINV